MLDAVEVRTNWEALNGLCNNGHGRMWLILVAVKLLGLWL